jgi:hypothetical protein
MIALKEYLCRRLIAGSAVLYCSYADYGLVDSNSSIAIQCIIIQDTTGRLQ